MDHTKFNVWVWNWDNDSTKTVAFPYTEFPHHQATVDAFNYQYPVTIRWDLSLVSAPWLPQEGGPINAGAIYNQYFYYFNNCGDPPCGYFDMMIADSVVVPQPDPNFLFPVGFTLGHLNTTSISRQLDTNAISIWPNPVHGRIHIGGIKGNAMARIYSAMGTLLSSSPLDATGNTIIVDDLPDGTYVLSLTTPNGNEHFKFIKAR